jgi:futalosine hydrolase
MLAEAVGVRPVVLLSATDREAEPIRAALLSAEQHVVATKTLFLGELQMSSPLDLRGSSDAEGGNRSSTGPTVPVALAIGGCDKANTAHMLTWLLCALRPAPLLVIQVGIAGAFSGFGPGPDLGVKLGDIVLATQEAYSDTGSSSLSGWLSAAELGLPIARVDGFERGGVFPLDAALVEAARQAIEGSDWPGAQPVIHRGPCVTTSCVTGVRADAEAVFKRWGALAESMEGAAAAHICALYRVAFLEIRGISNLVGDRDREAWQVQRAVAGAGRAALAVVAALPRLSLAAARGMAGEASAGDSG